MMKKAPFGLLPWVVILPLVLVSVFSQLKSSQSLWPMDFYHYWVVKKIVSDQKPVNIYSQETRRHYARRFLAEAEATPSEKLKYSAGVWEDELLPTGTPFLYMALSPLMRGDYDLDLELFRLLSLIVYLIGLVAMARLLRFPWPLSLFTILLFSGTFEPHAHDVWVGNLNQIQIGMIAFLLWSLKISNRNTAGLFSGILFAFLLLFKPSVLYVFVLLVGVRVVVRDFHFLKKFFVSFMGSAVVIGICSGLFFGSLSIWTEWFVGIREMLGGERYFFLTFLGHILQKPPMALFFSLGIILVAFPLSVLWRTGAHRFPVKAEMRDEFFVALGLGIYLLAGNVIHSHYFMLSIPLLLVVWQGNEIFRGNSESRNHWMPVLGSVAFLMICGNFFQVLFPLELRFDISFWSYMGVLILVGSCFYSILPPNLRIRRVADPSQV
jgi:hypothetical protein